MAVCKSVNAAQILCVVNFHMIKQDSHFFLSQIDVVLWQVLLKLVEREFVTAVQSKNIVKENVLQSIPVPHNVQSHQGSEFKGEVSFPISRGLCFNWVNHEFLKFVDLRIVHWLEALSGVTCYPINIFLLKLSNVIHQILNGLATREEASNWFVDGGVGDGNAKYRVASSHHTKSIIDEQVAAHQFVNHQFLHQQERRVRCKHGRHSYRINPLHIAIRLICRRGARFNLVHPSSIHRLVQYSFKGGVVGIHIGCMAASHYWLAWSSALWRRGHLKSSHRIQICIISFGTTGRHVTNVAQAELSVAGGGRGCEHKSSGGSTVGKHWDYFVGLQRYLIIKIRKHEFKFEKISRNTLQNNL